MGKTNCPALKTACHICNKIGHLSKLCRSKHTTKSTNYNEMTFSKNTTSDNYDELTFSEIHTNPTEAYVNLKLTNYIKSRIRAKIDTGAQ